MSTLEIKDLHVSVEDKEILRGVDLTIHDDEVHALMGPNGNGKSTLLAAIMGNPKYTVTQGTITLDGQDVLSLSVDERSRAGLFLGMQYPSEVPGVTNSDFLRSAMNVRQERPVSLFKFIKGMDHAIQQLEMKPDLAHRFLNVGFSVILSCKEASALFHGDDTFFNRDIFLDNLFHLCFDCTKLVGGERFYPADVIVPAAFQSRTDTKLGSREQMLDSLCHHMGSGMPECLFSVLVIKGADFQLAVLGDWGAQVNRFAVDSAAAGCFCKTCAQRFCYVDD